MLVQREMSSALASIAKRRRFLAQAAAEATGEDILGQPLPDLAWYSALNQPIAVVPLRGQEAEDRCAPSLARMYHQELI